MNNYSKIILLYLVLIFPLESTAIADYNPATGEDDFVIISEAQEVNMGKSLADGVEKKFGIERDSAIQARVNEVGQAIAKVCDRPELTYSFSVLDGKELEEEARHNAFALPGGYVYLFKEMVDDTESSDELAAILAHEIGHIVAKHSVKKLQASIGMAGLSIISSVAPGDNQAKQKASYAVSQLMMAYSREAEFEADKLSIAYLKKAGYDPKAAVSFIDRMLKKQLKGSIDRYHYFRTHPYISERRAMLNKEIEGAFEFNDYINAPPEKETSFWQ